MQIEQITLSIAAAREVRPTRDRLLGREKKGAQTLMEIEILSAIADSLPPFFDVGDEVLSDDSKHDQATIWVIDSFANGGSLATVCTVDRETWDVLPIEGLTARVSDA